jgi:hypothetical protein
MHRAPSTALRITHQHHLFGPSNARWGFPLISHRPLSQVSGPIAIISVGAELARNDLANLFQFAAIVNINLAVVNTLPLPALDGGYLALLIVRPHSLSSKGPDPSTPGQRPSGAPPERRNNTQQGASPESNLQSPATTAPT